MNTKFNAQDIETLFKKLLQKAIEENHSACMMASNSLKNFLLDHKTSTLAQLTLLYSQLNEIIAKGVIDSDDETNQKFKLIVDDIATGGLSIKEILSDENEDLMGSIRDIYRDIQSQRNMNLPKSGLEMKSGNFWIQPIDTLKPHELDGDLTAYLESQRILNIDRNEYTQTQHDNELRKLYMDYTQKAKIVNNDICDIHAFMIFAKDAIDAIEIKSDEDKFESFKVEFSIALLHVHFNNKNTIDDFIENFKKLINSNQVKTEFMSMAINFIFESYAKSITNLILDLSKNSNIIYDLINNEDNNQIENFDKDNQLMNEKINYFENKIKIFNDCINSYTCFESIIAYNYDKIDKIVMESYDQIATYYYDLGKFDESIKYLEFALKYATKINDQKKIIDIQYQLLNMYSDQAESYKFTKNNNTTLDYFKKIILLGEKFFSEDPVVMADVKETIDNAKEEIKLLDTEEEQNEDDVDSEEEQNEDDVDSGEEQNEDDVDLDEEQVNDKTETKDGKNEYDSLSPDEQFNLLSYTNITLFQFGANNTKEEDKNKKRKPESKKSEDDLENTKETKHRKKR